MCRNTLWCITSWEQGRAGVVLQYSHCAHDTAKLGAGLDAGAHWEPKARSRGRRGAGASRRWGVGPGACGARRRARGRARQVAGRAGVLVRGCGAQLARQAAGRAGAWARGAAGAAGARGARGTGAGHAAWARSLGARPGQGCALGALGLFLARFDSVFFLSQIFGHCS